MKKRDRTAPSRIWSTRYFADEDRELATTRWLPLDAATLKTGDRVSFDLGEGVDGPPFATNVRRLGETP